MDAATGQILEPVLEYCQTILNAETEEEIVVIRQSVTEELMNMGANEADIDAYLLKLDVMVAKLKSGEITIDEDGHLVSLEDSKLMVVTDVLDGELIFDQYVQTIGEEDSIQTEIAMDGSQEVENNSQEGMLAMAGVTLVASAIVLYITMKRHADVLKRKLKR